MRVVALISGGKDSIYNAILTTAEGHEIVALANLHPKDKDELDSYMYQTVGHMGIVKIAEAMELPLYRRETKGNSVQRGKSYEPTNDDEVEDLFELLSDIKSKENIEAVASGAILSDYQRVRVENVCQRLNLVSLSYLWRRDQSELLQEMIDSRIDAILIKVAALGLTPAHLGKSITEMKPYLFSMKDKYNLNVCGEGGEYETFTLDCPLFKKRIEIEDMQVVISSSDVVCPVGYINFTKLVLVPKSTIYKICPRTSLDFIRNLTDNDEDVFLSPDADDVDNILENNENELLTITNALDIVKSASNSSLSTIQQQQQHQHQEDNQNNDQFTKEKENLRDVDSKNLVCVKNTPTSVENGRGWLWISGLQSNNENSTPTAAMNELLCALEEILAKHEFTMRDLVRITMYINNMNDYAELNEAYVKALNFVNPPTRICVEVVMPPGCVLIIEALAHKFQCHGSMADVSLKRSTLHIQGISHWAPANIGPYSQSIKIGSITYVSGQIALVPGTMKILDGDITAQTRLVLRHISRITDVMKVKRKLRDVVQGICYVSKRSHVAAARREWESQTTNAIMDYIIVSRLPRDALIELQVWAHNYNDKFEYEETGRSIGSFSISFKKRWNYESECVAVICTISTYTSTATTPTTPISTSFTKESFFQSSSINLLTQFEAAKEMEPEQLREVFEYLLRKMLPNITSTSSTSENHQHEKVPAIHIRVFYDALKAPNFVQQVADAFRQDKTNVQIALSVIPVCGLQKPNDFISICAIKHE